MNRFHREWSSRRKRKRHGLHASRASPDRDPRRPRRRYAGGAGPQADGPQRSPVIIGNPSATRLGEDTECVLADVFPPSAKGSAPPSLLDDFAQSAACITSLSDRLRQGIRE